MRIMHVKSVVFGIILVFHIIEGKSGCTFQDSGCTYDVRMVECTRTNVKFQQVGDVGSCCGDVKVQSQKATVEAQHLIRKVRDLQTKAKYNGQTHVLSHDELKSLLTSKQTELQQVNDKLAEKKSILLSVQEKLSEANVKVNQTQTTMSERGDHWRNEIQYLHNRISNETMDFNNCKGVLQLKKLGYNVKYNGSVQTTHVSPPYTQTFCSFESMCGYTQDRDEQDSWTLTTGQPDSNTGPTEDHTYGSPKGRYLMMNAKSGASNGRATTKIARVTSQPFPNADNYCIQFWYNMHGKSVKPISIYAKVGNGRGYPVMTIKGDKGPYWHLAEVSLDSEYTARHFSLVFEASHNAYYRTSYYSPHHHSQVTYYGADADVAIDDVYVYNTTCHSLPTCTPGSYVRTDNGSSSGSCYTFHTTPQDWYQSSLTCRKEGANSHLVTVNSQEEQDFLTNLINQDSVLKGAETLGWYTGGNDERKEHTFYWTDSGTPYVVKYTDWHTGQPNNVGSNQDCLLLEYAQNDYEWGDVDCRTKHPFICEVDLPIV